MEIDGKTKIDASHNKTSKNKTRAKQYNYDNSIIKRKYEDNLAITINLHISCLFTLFKMNKNVAVRSSDNTY